MAEAPAPLRMNTGACLEKMFLRALAALKVFCALVVTVKTCVLKVTTKKRKKKKKGRQLFKEKSAAVRKTYVLTATTKKVSFLLLKAQPLKHHQSDSADW